MAFTLAAGEVVALSALRRLVLKPLVSSQVIFSHVCGPQVGWPLDSAVSVQGPLWRAGEMPISAWGRQQAFLFFFVPQSGVLIGFALLRLHS